MLPSVKPDLVIFDYHQTLRNMDVEDFFEDPMFPSAIDFVCDLKRHKVLCAMVTMGEKEEVLEDLKAVRVPKIFDYSYYLGSANVGLLAFLKDLFKRKSDPDEVSDFEGIVPDDAKQQVFQKVIQKAYQNLGREPVVWFIGDHPRDFPHFGGKHQYKIDAFPRINGDGMRNEYSIMDYAQARQELAVVLKPESLTPSADLG
jgi:hypothetical protein